jgi:hypothetical protein
MLMGNSNIPTQAFYSTRLRTQGITKPGSYSRKTSITIIKYSQLSK